MAANDNDTEKSFEPTPRKLQEARRKGDVAKSQDVNATFSYAGFFVGLYVLAFGASDLVFSNLTQLWRSPEFVNSLDSSLYTTPMIKAVFSSVASFILILLLTPALFTALSITVQRSFTFSGQKLMPKLSRISPLSIAKQKFGMTGIFEWFKNTTKAVIFSIGLTLLVLAYFEDILAASALHHEQSILLSADVLEQMFWVIFFVSLVLGVIDYLFQRYDHRRKLMMSRKEIEDETKESEGDPKMKQERRQRGREISMNQTLQDVATADVVITNPTHYAVALKWSREAGSAPTCVSKGVDEFAAAVRRVAHENDVPIFEDPPTARALFATTDVGVEIPVDLYKAVAAAIRFADEAKRRAVY